MLYFIESKYSKSGTVQFKDAIALAKSKGGALVLSDDTTFRGGIDFTKECLEANIPFYLGVKLNVVGDDGGSGFLRLAAINEKGVANLRRVLNNVYKSEVNLKNRRYGDSDGSLGANYDQVCTVGDLGEDLGEDLTGLIFFASDPDMINSEWFSPFRSKLGSRLIGGVTPDMHYNDSELAGKLLSSLDGRCVSSANLSYMTEGGQYVASGKASALGSINYTAPSKYNKFNAIDTHLGSNIRHVNDDVKSKTESFIKNAKVVSVLKEEEVPDLGVKSDLIASTKRGLDEYLNKNPQLEHRRSDYQNLLKLELSVIEEMDFSTYFDTVLDFVSYMRQRGVRVGYRGSAGVSLVLFLSEFDPDVSDALKTSNLKNVSVSQSVDPYDLYSDEGELDRSKVKVYLSRFISKSRLELPDIDVEVSHKDIHLFKEYMVGKVGSDSIATLMTESVASGMSTCLDVASKAYDELTKTNPEFNKMDKKQIDKVKSDLSGIFGKWDYRNSTFSEVIADNKITRYFSKSKELKALFKLASMIEGQNLTTSKHTSGYVVSGSDGFSAPTMLDKSGSQVIELSGSNAKSVGYVKFDILSSRILSTLHLTEKLISDHDKSFNFSLNKVDGDLVTFLKDNVSFITQYSGNAVKARMDLVDPKNIQDLLILIAISRPNVSKEDVNIFKKNKGRNAQDMILPNGFDDPVIRKIFKPTGGILLFDEQVLLIADQVAHLPPEKSDLLRTAIRKGKYDLFDSLEHDFVSGAMVDGRTESASKEIFSSLRGLVGKYGFGTAHAYTYVGVALEHAALKRDHPAEAYQGIWEYNNYKKETSSKFEALNREYENRGIRFIPPSLNHGLKDFSEVRNNNKVYISPSAAKVFKGNNESGVKLFNALEEYRDRVNISNQSLKDIIDGIYTDVTGIPLNTRHSKGEEAKVLDLISNLETLAYMGVFDGFGLDSPSVINADLITRRERIIGFIEPYINSLSGISPKESIEIFECEINTEELIMDEFKAFGFSPIKSLNIPQNRYNNTQQISLNTENNELHSSNESVNPAPATSISSYKPKIKP